MYLWDIFSRFFVCLFNLCISPEFHESFLALYLIQRRITFPVNTVTVDQYTLLTDEVIVFNCEWPCENFILLSCNYYLVCRTRNVLICNYYIKITV